VTSGCRGWRLADRLYIGPTPRLADVECLGITGIVRVARPPVPPEVVAAVSDHVRWPLSDGARVSGPDVMNAARSVGNMWRYGDTVLVSCVAGRNRSALVASVALVQLGLVARSEVIEYVRWCRPRALANASAVAWLERWLARTGAP
jgi:hypothetical protein